MIYNVSLIYKKALNHKRLVFQGLRFRVCVSGFVFQGLRFIVFIKRDILMRPGSYSKRHSNISRV